MEITSLKTNVLEEIYSLLVEGEFAARDILIKTYYEVGRIIIENDLSVQLVAQFTKRSKRSIYYMTAL